MVTVPPAPTLPGCDPTGLRESTGALGRRNETAKGCPPTPLCAANYRVTIAKLSEWMSVFGGAQPRELVLKERGVDESVIVGTDLAHSSAPSPISVRTPIEGNRTSSGSLGYGTKKQEKMDERSRMSVFGGARPRELVLKERGVDESVIVGTDLAHSSTPSPITYAMQCTHTY
ncbi:hypothetical protein GOP47_0000868 [Adiantum capillus-veneris]|uniref:Uncharacterized protein n=1 Tax=Adiantum capillus-veneris TaxID=13818 RepID=A0A9D4ZQX5_ADICA|nr:hypothetical protein GOP47_0000868 [Adiantum capillus-veneris]